MFRQLVAIQVSCELVPSPLLISCCGLLRLIWHTIGIRSLSETVTAAIVKITIVG